MKTIRNIVFDYGGVLIDLDFSLTLNAMERLGVNAFGKEITNVYTCKGVLGLYERGEISTDEFRDYIRSLSTHKGLSNEAIDQAWCALMLDVPTYKQQLLLQLKQKYKIYMLSNTNPLHVDCSLERCFGKDGHTPHDYFDRFFFSHDMHLSKPDPLIFRSFISESGVDPTETLYIDDAPANVKAGGAASLISRLYIPGEDLTHLLAHEGLLT